MILPKDAKTQCLASHIHSFHTFPALPHVPFPDRDNHYIPKNHTQKPFQLYSAYSISSLLLFPKFYQTIVHYSSIHTGRDLKRIIFDPRSPSVFTNSGLMLYVKTFPFHGLIQSSNFFNANARESCSTIICRTKEGNICNLKNFPFQSRHLSFFSIRAQLHQHLHSQKGLVSHKGTILW
jgi:hypothetical protein